MFDPSFIDSLYTAVYSNESASKKTNKNTVLSRWKNKLSKLSKMNEYQKVENALNVSMNIYKKNNTPVYQTNKIRSKHANLIIEKDMFKPIAFMNGGGSQMIATATNNLSDCTKGVEGYVLHEMPHLDANMTLSNLPEKDRVALMVMLKQFQPEKEDMEYMYQIIIRMNEKELIYNTLLLQSGGAASGATRATRGTRGRQVVAAASAEPASVASVASVASPDPPPRFIPEPTNSNSNHPLTQNISIDLGIKSKIQEVIDFKMNISIGQFLKLFVMICFFGAFILNPILQYVGFHRMMSAASSFGSTTTQGTLNLPNFYIDQPLEKSGSLVNYKLKNNELLIQTNGELSQDGQVFTKRVLKDPTYMIQNVLPFVKFTPSDIVKSNLDIKDEMVPVFEKLYRTMKSNQQIEVPVVKEHQLTFQKYFERLFPKKYASVMIDDTVMTYLQTALSKMHRDEKQRVLNYNRMVLSKYKNEMLKLVVANNQMEKNAKLNQIKSNFEADYKSSMALKKVNTIKYCLSTPGFTEVDKVTHVLNCIEMNVLTQGDIAYAKQFENFKDFFNNLGLLYNQISSPDSQFTEQTVSFITDSVKTGYNDYLYIGVSGFKNAFVNELTRAIHSASLTPTETVALNNIKQIGGMNVFNVFLDMYSADIKELIPGGKLVSSIVDSITNFANKNVIRSFNQALNRIITSIENDMKLKEQLFLDTNYDTDLVIDMLKNKFGASATSSFTASALRSVSQTNIDLFVDIKMKNIVLQILKIISGSTSSETSRLSASLTDLFYIIPYYTHNYYDEVEMTQSGGKKQKKGSTKPKAKSNRSNA